VGEGVETTTASTTGVGVTRATKVEPQAEITIAKTTRSGIREYLAVMKRSLINQFFIE
jgi:hypothetical protein